MTRRDGLQTRADISSEGRYTLRQRPLADKVSQIQFEVESLQVGSRMSMGQVDVKSFRHTDYVEAVSRLPRAIRTQ